MYEKYERKPLCDCVHQLRVVLNLPIPMLEENELLEKHFYAKNNKVDIFVTLRLKFMCKLQR
jgi:hypothetical protein